MDVKKFLPVSREDMLSRGWDEYDFLLITGDAYVDHPSFGTPLIGRLLEDAGYRVAILAQPDWHSAKAFSDMGRPRLGAMVSSGNLDSMVAHYSAAKRRRREDFYSPGKKAGLRPDRAVIVYASRVREAFPGLPLVIGGLEASLRRFAHYDYWDDKVRRSVLFDAKADLLVYGMGESATLEIARRLKAGEAISDMTDIRGTACSVKSAEACAYSAVRCASFEQVSVSNEDYARAAMIEYREHDPIRGKAIIQPHGDRLLIVNPPQMPLDTKQLDHVAELPYARNYHPMYEDMGGVPGLEEVKYSVIHNRGCFGACNFCSLAFHQGRMVTARSEESVVREVTAFTKDPDFKGIVHDVGGPTANFSRTSCDKQLKSGLCANRNCLTPEPCPNLVVDHSAYLSLLRRLRNIPGVRRVFVRSGIRFDYLTYDKNGTFFSELVKYHVSGQLKVAPEHCVDNVLGYMGKPKIKVYEDFSRKYASLNQRAGKEQYLVPYLISSHPGSTMNDAIRLAEYLRDTGRRPEQVQDFYPTPGTLSTCMYHTGIDPRTMKPVYVPRDPREKAMQRALLQYTRPENGRLVREALRSAGREDLIGYGPKCLVRPERSAPAHTPASHAGDAKTGKTPAQKAKSGPGGAAESAKKLSRPRGGRQGARFKKK